jgi:hypothetical protein
MKINPTFFTRLPCIAALAVTSALALPLAASARDHGHHSSHHYGSSRYYSHPRTSFVLSLGNGYAGRGYYYGPPGYDYYYERPEVRYYARRELAPREYWGSDYGVSNTNVAVQRALARNGYYYGAIDGDIGPASRRAIANYQARHGMSPSGAITSSLLRSLGIY